MNSIQECKVVTLHLKRGGKYLYSYDHAVINDLHCSKNPSKNSKDAAISDEGREIVVEKDVSKRSGSKSKGISVKNSSDDSATRRSF